MVHLRIATINVCELGFTHARPLTYLTRDIPDNPFVFFMMCFVLPSILIRVHYIRVEYSHYSVIYSLAVFLMLVIHD